MNLRIEFVTLLLVGIILLRMLIGATCDLFLETAIGLLEETIEENK
jgi:hypothetical protein